MLRYIKSTPSQWLLLWADFNLQLHTFCDSDWVSYPITWDSLNGFFLSLLVSRQFLGDLRNNILFLVPQLKWNIVLWPSHAMSWNGSIISVWSSGSSNSTTPLFCDNQVILFYISSNHVFHECIKHIEIVYHFIRNELQAQRITPAYIPTEAQPMDIFTKALGQSQFHLLLGKLGICNLHTPTWGRCWVKDLHSFGKSIVYIFPSL